MGREGQLPPLVAEMVESARKANLEPVVDPLFDRDGQYIGYRVEIKKGDDVVRALDVTGAASRFIPWHLVPVDKRARLKAELAAASDLDAPPESGNFDGGFVASATQAARYGRNRRAKGPSP